MKEDLLTVCATLVKAKDWYYLKMVLNVWKRSVEMIKCDWQQRANALIANMVLSLKTIMAIKDANRQNVLMAKRSKKMGLA